MVGRKFGQPRWLAVLLLACVLPVLAACGEYPQTTFRPVTDFGTEIDRLFWWVFWLTMLVLVVVQGLLLYILFRFRGRPGAPRPKPVYGHTGLEVTWTVIPAIIIVSIAVPTIQGIFAVQAPASEDALVVEVVGHQFWWEFRYPEYGIVTANQFYLPVGRQVELRLRSADVIHSFWVPMLGGKRDVNPQLRLAEGQERDQWNRIVFTVSEEGAYSGECAEFCGQSHALMRKRAVAVSQAEFAGWVRSMTQPVEPAPGTLEDEGRQIFMRSSCIACHAIAGTNAMGVLGPNLTRFGDRWAVGAGLLPNTRENLVAWIKDPAALKPGVLMPGTQRGLPSGMAPTGLSDAEVEAVAAYLLSLR